MAVKIFFCYAREDEALLNKLKAQLRPLQRQGLIDVWHDRDISPGTEWEQEIKERLNAAEFILLLISPDFMDSDYIHDVELKRAIERHNCKEACVIPVILRPVHWQVELLDKLQALPTDAVPVTIWENQDRALFDIAEGIRKAIQQTTSLSLSSFQPFIQPRRNSPKVLLMIGLLLLVLLVLLVGGTSIFLVLMQQINTNKAHALATAQAQQSTATAFAETPQSIYLQATSGNLALADPLNVSDSIALPETSTNGVGGCSFAGEAYHARVQVQGNVLWCPAGNTNFSNFAYQVQMTTIKGDGGGIIFRFYVDSTGNYFGYGFNIDQNGSFDFYRVGANEEFTHLHSGTSLSIKTGLNQTNLIAVVARGSNIYVFVNRQFVTSVIDSTFSSGEIGVQAGENALPTEVVFQNAQVWEI